MRKFGFCMALLIVVVGLIQIGYFLEQAFFDAETKQLGLRVTALAFSLPGIPFVLLGIVLAGFWRWRMKETGEWR